MGEGSQKAIDALAEIIKEMKMKLVLSEIAYRIDHQDYQVTFSDGKFDDSHHAEIPEPLIETFLATKNNDAKRDIKYKLSNPAAYEHWEQEDNVAAEKEERIDIDKDL